MAWNDATTLTSGNAKLDLFLLDVLTRMEQRLQTLGYINRQLEAARANFAQGDTIKLQRSGKHTVQSTPFANMAAVPQLAPEDSEMKIDQYLTCGMRQNDFEQVLVGSGPWLKAAERMGFDLASQVEREVHKLFLQVPHMIPSVLSTFAPATLIDTNVAFQELGVPEDGATLRRFVNNPLMWGKLLGQTQFTQYQGAGPDGVASQTTGQLAEKFGLVPYASNMLWQDPAPTNAPTGNTASTAAPAGAAIVSGATKGSKEIVLTYTGLASPTVFTAGMVIQLATAGEGLLAPTAGTAYRNQLYAVKSSTVASAPNITVTLYQGLRQAHSGSWRRIIQAAADATVLLGGGFYADAFALAMVELPPGAAGVLSSVVGSREAGLSLRARLVYDAFSGIGEKALLVDGMFGVKCIDPDKAVRVPVNLSA